MTEILGRCNKKQYEHSGLHPQYADVGQRLPPFGCENWIAEPPATQPVQTCVQARAVNNLLGFLKVTPLKLNEEDAMTLSALINAITTDVEQGEQQ